MKPSPLLARIEEVEERLRDEGRIRTLADWCLGAGVSKNYLSTLKTRLRIGKASARGDELHKLAAFAGVTVEYLLAKDGDAPPRQPSFVRLVGSDALERVLATFEWPDVDIAIVDVVMKDARAEASSTGKDRPESAWKLQVTRLLRERTGRAKDVPARGPQKPADLTQESEEVRGARKRPRRT